MLPRARVSRRVSFGPRFARFLGQFSGRVSAKGVCLIVPPTDGTKNGAPTRPAGQWFPATIDEPY
jgi:hypothetical protein